jgi:hypothetical protein
MSRTVVAAELRARISRAIEEMTNATVMDEKTRRKKCLNQITRILVGLQGLLLVGLQGLLL